MSDPSVLVAIRCRGTKEEFLLRLSHQGAQWAAVDRVIHSGGATPGGPAALGMREVQQQVNMTGEFIVAPSYQGCPFCERRGQTSQSYAKCNCGNLCCWGDAQQDFPCPWCATILHLDGTIQSLEGFVGPQGETPGTPKERPGPDPHLKRSYKPGQSSAQIRWIPARAGGLGDLRRGFTRRGTGERALISQRWRHILVGGTPFEPLTPPDRPAPLGQHRERHRATKRRRVSRE